MEKEIETKTDKPISFVCNILQKYCNDWCLNINTSKTTIIVFNKAGRLSKSKFNFADVKLECVSEYKYLGVSFCSSGSFSFAQKQLYQNALNLFSNSKRISFLWIQTSKQQFTFSIIPLNLFYCTEQKFGGILIHLQKKSHPWLCDWQNLFQYTMW